MTIAIKQYSRHRLSLKKRDCLGYNAADRLHLSFIGKGILILGTCYNKAKQYRKLGVRKVVKVFSIFGVSLLVALLRVVLVDHTELENPERREGHVSFDDYAGYLVGDSTFSEYFRFQSLEQLRMLCEGFMLPDRVLVKRSLFTGEEVLIISLLRLTYPSRWTDVINKLPRHKARSRCECGRAFYYFLDFIVSNWAYLVLNNMDYWFPLLGYFAQSIRHKLSTLVTVSYRQVYDVASVVNGELLGFIDWVY